MAKRAGVNKSQAVREYLRSNRKAANKEISEALGAKGIKISPNHVANIRAKAKGRRLSRRAKAAGDAAPQAEVATPASDGQEKPSKPGEAITLEQIKKVAQTVKAIGGFDRLRELLEVIREVDGPRKFKDLWDAMSVAETGKIPF